MLGILIYSYSVTSVVILYIMHMLKSYFYKT